MENNNTELNNNTENTEKAETEGKFYTDEEIALLQQQAGDKRISQYQKTLEKKQRESEKLRNMNDDDRRIYELEQRERILEEKEAQMQLIENKNECINILVEKGLPAQLVDMVLDSDADTCHENIKKLDKYFKQAVKAEVERRLAGKSPVVAPMEQRQTLTRKEIANMSVFELQQLKAEQPELFQ